MLNQSSGITLICGEEEMRVGQVNGQAMCCVDQDSTVRDISTLLIVSKFNIKGRHRLPCYSQYKGFLWKEEGEAVAWEVWKCYSMTNPGSVKFQKKQK